MESSHEEEEDNDKKSSSGVEEEDDEDDEDVDEERDDRRSTPKTEEQAAASSSEPTPVVVVMARSHAGEAATSFVTQGFVDFLLSKHEVAKELRQYVVFKVRASHMYVPTYTRRWVFGKFWKIHLLSKQPKIVPSWTKTVLIMHTELRLSPPPPLVTYRWCPC